MKSMLKDAAILFAITVIAGLALGFVYQVTKAPIAQQEIKAKNEACAEVFKEADSFVPYEAYTAEGAVQVLEAAGLPEESIEEVMTAVDAAGTPLGYVITVVTHEGYGGDIKFTMGVQLDGTMNGLSILSISETAGLGMKADTDAFKAQWMNKQVDSFEYTKSGATADNQIDAISGATITTNAVTNGVNAGLAYFKSIEGGAQNE
ncbi:MAG: RnfABCDGE type electron transport complex subunit G [Lachnospiraceae bacterium]